MFVLTSLTTLSNALTLLRAPLALLFLHKSLYIRIFSVFFAMLTDGLDGYFARRYRTVSRLGTVLDPIMDRFFVLFTLSIFVLEKQLSLWEMSAMLSRDIVLVLFAIYVTLFGNVKSCEFMATFWGKATTFSQFCMVIGLTFGYSFPWYIYACFVVFGLLLIKELFTLYRHSLL